MSDDIQQQFDAETWESLPRFLEKLPRPVRLNVWGSPEGGQGERQAIELAQGLAGRFETIHYRQLPRRVNYPYYPVIGVMGLEGDEEVDYGVRLIGLPAGYQMTSLIAGVQCVAFEGMTSEARTRIFLHRLNQPVNLELITSAEDEMGGVMAQMIFNMAVASPHVRSHLIMGDAFPEAVIRYSVSRVPHLVINSRVHLSGVVDEEKLLKQIAAAL